MKLEHNALEVLFKAIARLMLAAGGTFRIRDLATGEEGTVRVKGGASQLWLPAELKDRISDSDGVPFIIAENSVDILCQVTGEAPYSRARHAISADAWAARGVDGSYVAMSFTIGEKQPIHLGGLQDVAEALNWYERNEPAALSAWELAGAQAELAALTRATTTAKDSVRQAEAAARPAPAGGPAPFPFIFVVSKALFNGREWRRRQTLTHAAARSLGELVHQYVMEVEPDGGPAISSVVAA